jgi:hypothetical protein
MPFPMKRAGHFKKGVFSQSGGKTFVVPVSTLQNLLAMSDSHSSLSPQTLFAEVPRCPAIQIELKPIHSSVD